MLLAITGHHVWHRGIALKLVEVIRLTMHFRTKALRSRLNVGATFTMNDNHDHSHNSSINSNASSKECNLQPGV